MNSICLIKNLNTIGLILLLIGTFIAYLNSPLNFHSIDGGDSKTDHKKEEKIIKRKNKLMKLGIYLIMIGTLLQILSSFFNK
jgi:uncharacterized membrane protein